MTTRKQVFLALLACTFMSAKNFGPDITPLEFFLLLIFLILMAILFFGGPFGTYYWMTAKRTWLKAIAVLSVLVNISILILCCRTQAESIYILLLSAWNLLTCASFILGLRKVLRTNGKRN